MNICRTRESHGLHLIIQEVCLWRLKAPITEQPFKDWYPSTRGGKTQDFKLTGMRAKEYHRPKWLQVEQAENSP